MCPLSIMSASPAGRLETDGWSHLRAPSLTSLGLVLAVTRQPQHRPTPASPGVPPQTFSDHGDGGLMAGILKERTPGRSCITLCDLALQESQHYFHRNLLIRSKSPKPVHIQEEGNQAPPLIGRNAKALGGRGWDWKYCYSHLWKIKYLFTSIIFKRRNYLYIYCISRLEASIYL